MKIRQIIICLVISGLFIFNAKIFAQSMSQDFPIPVLQSEISGKILARDIGDARLTSRFYTFYANNGDLNLRLETENFNGDVDIFIAQTLRPLAKVSVFASDAVDVTTKTVYFRKREQVILRVEGRTLNDNPANFKISFSGSFEAGNDLPSPAENGLPKIAENKIDEEKGGVRVNSAGTIVEIVPPKPKPTPTPKIVKPKPETIAKAKPKTPVRKTTPKPKSTPKTESASNNETVGENKTETPTSSTEPPTETEKVIEKPSDNNGSEKPAENPVTTSNTASIVKPKKPAKTPKTKVQPKPKVETPKTGETTAETKPKIAPKPKPVKAKKPKKPAPVEFDPNTLANLKLVVILKDGTKIERPMNDVFRVTVDKGELTVITKDGKIERYVLLDVQKFSIEQ